ncbi:MAG: murein transglycosylase A [Chromatiales bacterium]|nr:murein transglycosylase A [Chromatiales bacterium]
MLLGSLLSGCAGWFAPPPGIGREIGFSRLPGWAGDRHSEAWPALLRSCDKLPGRDPAWEHVCLAARARAMPDDGEARAFFEQYFTARVVDGEGGRDGLITGYYEPLLNGSRSRTERFRVPLYAPPDDLLTIDLGSLFPELKGRPVRGRLVGKRVVPYHSRAEITNGGNPLAGNELVWVDDPVEAFLLQVQGSGRVRLPDGSEIAVGYADQNGHPYRSLGNYLIALGVLTREEVTLPRVLEWIAANPAETGRLLNSNPSFIFFAVRDAALDGPIGSLGVPLIARRSVAVDPAFIALGLPVWLDTGLPDGTPFRQLAFAQDTGGAIKGAVRADLFTGRGPEAGRLAGTMKQRGRLYVLMPRPPPPVTAVSQR